MESDSPDMLTTYRSTIEFASRVVIKRIAGEERLRLLPTRYDSFVNELRIGRLFAHVAPAVPFPILLAADETRRTLTFEAVTDGVALGEKYADDLLLDDLGLMLGAACMLGAFDVRRSWMYRPPVEQWIEHHREQGHLGAAEAALAARAFQAAGEGRFAHGDLSPRNILKRADGSIVLIDWERAGVYPAGFDLAFLGYTTGRIPGARARIEAAVPQAQRAAFWLSLLLIALLHVDGSPQHGRRLDGTERSEIDAVIAQLNRATMRGSGDA